MARDRLSDFKLGMGDEIKVDKDWHSVGGPQVATREIATFSTFSSFF